MEKKILHIGRAPDNDIILEDESISKKHIQLSYENGTTFVRDVGSSNGTFINEVRIPLYELMPLQAGDELKLAQMVFPWQMYFVSNSTDNVPLSPEQLEQPVHVEEVTVPSISAEAEVSPTPKKSLKESIIRHKKKVNFIQDIAFYALLGLTLLALMLWYFTNVTKP